MDRRVLLTFFDLMGSRVIEAVEHLRISWIIPEFFNQTYITLIPKKDKPSGFSDCRPISLRNILYKLITKIITD